MKITLQWKAGCVGGDCEAFYEAPGGKVIQGKMLDPETRAMLVGLSADEDAVFVSDTLLRHLRG
jgi:hypothetical protein